MLTLPPSVRIYVATTPTDMRKQIDGLAATVREVIREDPLSGHLFVFFNRRGDLTKILFWDRNGYCMVTKRLERGVFRWPEAAREGATHVTLEAAELALILEGIDLRDAKRRPRWTPSPAPSMQAQAVAPL